ncbi:MAG: hypothetical protein ACTHKM_07480 [Tsuneonella sp.]
MLLLAGVAALIAGVVANLFEAAFDRPLFLAGGALIVIGGVLRRKQSERR